jgi:hypothetical protein
LCYLAPWTRRIARWFSAGPKKIAAQDAHSGTEVSPPHGTPSRHDVAYELTLQFRPQQLSNSTLDETF